MDDKEARHIAWLSLIATCAITVGATSLAIAFTFSVTALTLENLTDGQRLFLLYLWYEYLIAGTICIIGGLFLGWYRIFRWKKKDEQVIKDTERSEVSSIVSLAQDHPKKGLQLDKPLCAIIIIGSFGIFLSILTVSDRNFTNEEALLVEACFGSVLALYLYRLQKLAGDKIDKAVKDIKEWSDKQQANVFSTFASALGTAFQEIERCMLQLRRELEIIDKDPNRVQRAKKELPLHHKEFTESAEKIREELQGIRIANNDMYEKTKNVAVLLTTIFDPQQVVIDDEDTYRAWHNEARNILKVLEDYFNSD